MREVWVELQGLGEVLQGFRNLPQQGERDGAVEHRRLVPGVQLDGLAVVLQGLQAQPEEKSVSL